MRNNPSNWFQRVSLSLIAAIAAAIAIYMGLYQWGFINDVWDPVFGQQTEQVLASNISHILKEWFLIPDAILGAITYLCDIIFAFAGSSDRWRDRPWVVLLFGFYVIPPAIVSIILVILQGAVLETWCFLCLVSAGISIALICLAYNEVWVSIRFLMNVWKKSRNMQLVWNTLWGNSSEIAYEVSLCMRRKDVGTNR